jgi:hypothetical protein
MNELIFVYTLVGIIFGFAFAKIAYDPFYKVKFLRKLKRKPLGIAFFFAGNELFYKIIDLSKDVVRVKGGVFLNIPEFHYVLKQKVEGKEPTPELIQDLHYKDGIPCVFYDFRSLTPLVFEKTLEKADKTIFALPEQVEAILRKELVLTEAEILNLQKKKITNLLYIILFITAITLAFAFLSYSEIQNVSRISKTILNVTTAGIGV